MQTTEAQVAETADDSREFVILEAPSRAAAEALGADFDEQAQMEADHD